MIRKLIFKLKTIIFLFCFISLSCDIINANNIENSLQKADKFYKEFKYDEAEKIYLNLAKIGSLEAMFKLYDRFNSKKYRDYLFKAAEQGHLDSIKSAIDYLEFHYLDESGKSNYVMAENLYKKISHLDFPDKELLEELVEMYRDAGDFDVKKILKNLNLEYDANSYDPYFFWEIAEKVSISDGEYKDIANPKLMLQLVLLGGHSLAEVRSARYSVYKEFKEGAVLSFSIYNHITSGFGMAYCESRRAEKEKKEDEIFFKKIRSNLNENEKEILSKAINSAKDFFYEKADKEMGWCFKYRAPNIVDNRNFFVY